MDKSKYECTECGATYGRGCPNEGQHCNFAPKPHITPKPKLSIGLTTDAAARKNIPVFSGFVKYFPRGMCAVAELSRIANEQHNPGQPVHWAKEKSKDELDAFCRHMIDDVLGVPADTDNVLHATKMAWRAMANLERILDKQNG